MEIQQPQSINKTPLEFNKQLSSGPAINVDNCLGVSGGVDELSHFLKPTPVKLILA